MKWLSRNRVLLACCFTLSYMIMILAPLSFFFSNVDFIGTQLLDVLHYIAGAFLLTGTLIFMLFYSISILLQSARASRSLASVVSGLSLCIWIQSQLFTWDFGPLDGRGLDWTQWVSHMWIEAIVWSLLIFLCLLLGFKYKSFSSRVAYTNIFLALISTLLFLDISHLTMKRGRVNEYHEFKETIALHPTNNVIVIMLDSFRSDCFEHIVDHYPDDVSFLDGFTFFRNTIGSHPTTRPSVPGIMTNSTYRNMTTFNDYIVKAYSRFSIPEKFLQNRYSVSVIDNTSHSKFDISMQAFLDMHQSFPAEQFLQILDQGIFRLLPTYFKGWVYNENRWWLQNVLSSDYPTSPFRNDVRFVEIFEAKASPVKTNHEGKFFFVRLFAPHDPWILDENFAYDPNHAEKSIPDRYISHSRGALTLAKRMLRHIKRLGLYDKSTIVIMADHGHGGVGRLAFDTQGTPKVSFDVQCSALSLLLFKPSETRGTILVDDSPLYLSDLAHLLELDLDSDSGQDFARAIQSGERERHFYFYRWADAAWGHSYLPKIYKYSVQGHAYHPESWVDTFVRFDNGIREEVNLVYTLGSTVLFTIDGIGEFDDFLQTGFSSQEQNFRWTIGDFARILIKKSDYNGGDLIVRVAGSPYLGDGAIKQQIVDVTVNNNQVAQWIMDRGGETYRAQIPAKLVGEDGRLDIVFNVSTPTSPAELGRSTDPRRLGIAFRELVIEQAEQSFDDGQDSQPRNLAPQVKEDPQ